MDHPRSRGNHADLSPPVKADLGSPPLTREPRTGFTLAKTRLRITPAHAGTTQYEEGKTYETEDHPRSRGNHGLEGWQRKNIPGSPPLTREPLECEPSPHSVHRITPAHAGTTNKKTRRRIQMQDHPRSRGNHENSINDRI